MTSWIRAPLKKTEEKERSYFFQVTSSEDFAAQFLTYLYAYMYASSNSKSLFIYDQSNSVAANYELIRTPFHLPEGISYTQSIMPSAISLSGRQNRLVEFLTTLDPEQLDLAARQLFQWTDGMQEQMQVVMAQNGIPNVCDVGIHMTEGTVLSHMNAAKAAVTRMNLEAPTIFVVAPAIQTADFKRRAPPTWKIISIPEMPVTNRIPARVRLAAFVKYLTEIYVLQNAQETVVSLMNSVGKLLFLTSERPVSVDTQRFTFF